VLKTRTLIELSTTRLLLAVIQGGRTVDHRALQFDAAETSARWPAGLESIKSVLASWVAELKLQQTDTTILYTSPTSSASVFSCPAAAGAQGAVSAAELALRGTGAFTPGLSTLDAQPLVIKSPPRSSAPSEPQLHTLAAADTNLSTGALAAWAITAGLNPISILPIDVPALLAASTIVTSRPTTTVWMWFGEHASIIAAGSEGSLRFVRTISLGTESLIEALGRPIRSSRTSEAGPGRAEMISLTRPAARQLLFSAGVPQPGSIVDASLGINGADMLPLLQPVLQRVAIELKQSLRFSLSETERSSIALRLDGVGSLVTNLTASLAKLAGVEPMPSDSSVAAPVGELVGDPAAGTGTIAAWSSLSRCTLNLLPVELEREVTMHKVRSRSWAGFASAAALVAIYGSLTFLSLRAERNRLDALRIDAARTSPAGALQISAGLAAQQHTIITTQLARELGDSPPLGDLLAAISFAMPEGVRLTSLSIESQGRDADTQSPTLTCSVGAFAQTADPQQLAAALYDLSISLGKLPMVASVKLGSAHRTEIRGASVHKFDFSLSLVSIPHQLVRWQTADASLPMNGGSQ